MKIAIIGANGKAGSLIMQEALERGHEVTAVVRDAKKLGVSAPVIEKDLFKLKKEDVQDFEVIIDAFAAWGDEVGQHETSLAHLTQILSDLPDSRLLVVGGAGSLYVDPEHTLQLKDTEGFPESFKPLATAMGKGLDLLRKTETVNWTYFSPAANFAADGEKTGDYLLGGEEFILNSAGASEVSYADYAAAMLDEIEEPKHIRQRFTVIAK